MHRTGINFPVNYNQTYNTWIHKTHMPADYPATNADEKNHRIYYPAELSCCPMSIWANQL